MSNCYAIEDLIPVVDPTAYVHPTAVLIGDVIIGPRCYVGPAACLRGDFGRITLQDGANVQGTCVIHGFPETDTIIETDGHIGHGAVIHGAHIGPNVLVGMNAVVMDRSKIGESSIIGAMSFLREGTIIPPRSLAFGIPARVARELTEEEIAWKRRGTRDYQHLAVRSLASQRVVEPLRAVQPDRPRFCGGLSLTLGTTKALMKR
jgi:phenylacetic acid degradation protein